MGIKRNRTINNPWIWDLKAVPVHDNDDKRGKFRHDMDKSMGRAMTRYLGSLLELVFPDIDMKVTNGTLTITVTTITKLISPTVHITGDVVIDGNLIVNGTIRASGDVIGGGISLMHHTHPGCQGGSTGQPS